MELEEKTRQLPKFVLFWIGFVTLVIGSMILFNGSWNIFTRWYEINFPREAGIQPGATLDWGAMVYWYAPYAIVGCAVSIMGIFMMMNGERKWEGRSRPLVNFILYWAGVVASSIGLGAFLYGLSQAIIGHWYWINFPTEVWVPPEVPRDIWFPHLVYNMPYIFAGCVILMSGIFMMKNGQRRLEK